MIKTALCSVKIFLASTGVLVAGILLTLITIWVAKEIIIPKDLSQIQGVWLAHDGDEQLYGKLKLRIIGDSAYFGSRTFSDGRPDTLYSEGTKVRITKDSLVLTNKYNRNSYAWGLESLDRNHLVLTGDSYSYNFIRHNNIK